MPRRRADNEPAREPDPRSPRPESEVASPQGAVGRQSFVGAMLSVQRSAGNQVAARLVDVVQRDFTTYYDKKKSIQESSPTRSPRSPGITDEAAEGVGTMFREAEQQADPAWQQKLRDVSPNAGPSAPLDPSRMRASGRMLTPLLDQARERTQQDDPRWTGKLDTLKKERVGGGGTPGLVASVAKGHEDTRTERLAAAEEKRKQEEAQRARDLDAKPLVDGRADEVSKAMAATKKLTLDLGKRDALNEQLKKLKSSGRFEAALDVVDALVNECDKLMSYQDAKEKNSARIGALDASKGDRGRLVELNMAAIREIGKAPRDDVKVLAAIQALEDAIQPLEDAKAAREAAGLDRAAKRAEGLWPGNNNPAAVISKKNRADYGDTDEGKALRQALDALKDPSKPHTWARKWGAYHGNGEGNLPGIRAGGGYKEYYVAPAYRDNYTGVTTPGVRRLVVSDSTGFVYYSDNHYGQPNGRTLPAFYRIMNP